MNKERVHIAVIEPSEIIYEGLSNVLLKTRKHCFLYRISNLEELKEQLETKNFQLAIINPLAVQNKLNSFLRIRKAFSDLIVFAFVYSLFDGHLLSRFDDILFVNDPVSNIGDKLDHILEKHNNESDNKHEKLSDREIIVLTHLIQGLSNKEIADVLNISIHTVASHRKNITEKTGIKSLSGLTIYAISKKIVPLEAKNN